MSNYNYNPQGPGPHGQVPIHPPAPAPKQKKTLGLFLVGLIATGALVFGSCVGFGAGAATNDDNTPAPAPTVTETQKVEVPGPTKTVTAEPEPPKETEEQRSTQYTYNAMKTVLEEAGVILTDVTDDECVKTGAGVDFMLLVADASCDGDIQAGLDAVIKGSDSELFSHYVRGDNWVILTTNKTGAKNVRSIFGGELKSL